jgi:hypothetical protein
VTGANAGAVFEPLRIVVEWRLGGTLLEAGRLEGGYSGGSLYHVRARLEGDERRFVVKLGRVHGAPVVPDAAADARVYAARSWSHAPTHALLRERGLPVYDVLGESFPDDEVPYFWVAMSLLEGVDARGHRARDPDEDAAFQRCCGEALGALHAVGRPHDGPVDRETPYTLPWTEMFFRSLNGRVRESLDLGSRAVREHERLLRGWIDARRRRWVPPECYSLSQMDGLQGLARREAGGWRFQGHVDLEDFAFMDARFPLAGCELDAEGVRGRRPVPVPFFEGYRSRCAIDPSYVDARDLFKLYYLLSWLYIPYDPRYHASPEAMARSIADHEGAILALLRGERPVAALRAQ